MKSTWTIYWVESMKDDKRSYVGHSQDKTTGEVHYKFLERSKALKMIQDEKKLSPEYKYRLVKQTTTTQFGGWS